MIARMAFFKRCEQLVALQIAFVLRDIVARTITSLFAAMLCLTLLTASHLFYTFNGRASLLMVDMLAIAEGALVGLDPCRHGTRPCAEPAACDDARAGGHQLGFYQAPVSLRCVAAAGSHRVVIPGSRRDAVRLARAAPQAIELLTEPV